MKVLKGSPRVVETDDSGAGESYDLSSDSYHRPHQVVRVAEQPIPVRRWFSTGMESLDEAYGDADHAGMVVGSTVSLSGGPGVGKSTLLTQLADRIAQEGPVVYACGEEALDRITERAARLGLLKTDRARANFYAIEGTHWETLAEEIVRLKAVAFVLDSINIYSTDREQGSPGGVLQMRALGKIVTDFCHNVNHPRLGLVICQITKAGGMAGPKAVEHGVDVISHMKRPKPLVPIVHLNVSKNRFGNTEHDVRLVMTARGLMEKENKLQPDPGAATVPYPPD